MIYGFFLTSKGSKVIKKPYIMINDTIYYKDQGLTIDDVLYDVI